MHRFPKFAVTLSFMLFLTACQDGQGMMRKRFESNQDAKSVLEGVDGPKVSSVEAALRKSADDAEAKGDHLKALQFWVQLIDKSPDNPDYILNYADALRRTGAYSSAIAQYDKLRDDPKYQADALEGIGLASMAQGEYEQAGDAFAEVMEVDAARWRTINAIGILFTIRDMYPEAREYFAEALALAPSSVPVRNNIALMEAMDEQFDEAERLLMEAQKLAPKKSQQRMQVDMNLGLVYAIQGELKAAEETVRPWLSEAELLNNMGYYAHIAKDNQMATSYLNMALTKSDRHYDRAWKNLGSLNKLVKKSPARKQD